MSDPFNPDRRTLRGYQGKRKLPAFQLPLSRESVQRVHAICGRPECQ